MRGSGDGGGVAETPQQNRLERSGAGTPSPGGDWRRSNRAGWARYGKGGTMAQLKERLHEKIQAHRGLALPSSSRSTPTSDRRGHDRPDHRRRTGRAVLGHRHLVPRPVRRDPLPRQDDPGDVRGASKVPGCDYPYVEAFWWFLLTGEVPTSEETLGCREGAPGSSRRTDLRRQRAARDAGRLPSDGHVFDGHPCDAAGVRFLSSATALA